MPFDPNDPDTKAALKAAVDEAVETAKTGLEAKNAEVLDELKKTKAELRKVKDIDPADHAKLEGEVEKLTADLAVANKTAKDATATADKAAKALETEQTFTQKLLIQDGLKSALIANGVKDEDYIDMAVAKFAGSATVKIDGDKREALIGDKPLADAIKEWAGTDAGKKVVAAAVNGGGGASGSKDAKADVKTMPRTEYNEKIVSEPVATKQFIKDGGKIVDATA